MICLLEPELAAHAQNRKLPETLMGVVPTGESNKHWQTLGSREYDELKTLLAERTTAENRNLAVFWRCPSAELVRMLDNVVDVIGEIGTQACVECFFLGPWGGSFDTYESPLDELERLSDRFASLPVAHIWFLGNCYRDYNVIPERHRINQLINLLATLPLLSDATMAELGLFPEPDLQQDIGQEQRNMYGSMSVFHRGAHEVQSDSLLPVIIPQARKQNSEKIAEKIASEADKEAASFLKDEPRLRFDYDENGGAWSDKLPEAESRVPAGETFTLGGCLANGDLIKEWRRLSVQVENGLVYYYDELLNKLRELSPQLKNRANTIRNAVPQETYLPLLEQCQDYRHLRLCLERFFEQISSEPPGEEGASEGAEPARQPPRQDVAETAVARMGTLVEQVNLLPGRASSSVQAKDVLTQDAQETLNREVALRDIFPPMWQVVTVLYILVMLGLAGLPPYFRMPLSLLVPLESFIGILTIGAPAVTISLAASRRKRLAQQLQETAQKHFNSLRESFVRKLTFVKDLYARMCRNQALRNAQAVGKRLRFHLDAVASYSEEEQAGTTESEDPVLAALREKVKGDAQLREEVAETVTNDVRELVDTIRKLELPRSGRAAEQTRKLSGQVVRFMPDVELSENQHMEFLKQWFSDEANLEFPGMFVDKWERSTGVSLIGGVPGTYSVQANQRVDEWLQSSSQNWDKIRVATNLHAPVVILQKIGMTRQRARKAIACEVDTNGSA